MYPSADQVRLKSRFSFMETVKGVVEERFQENFDEALDEVLGSVR